MIPKLVGIGYFEATERGAREAARELRGAGGRGTKAQAGGGANVELVR